MTPLVLPAGHESSVLVVSMSGGKDSTATALRVIESGLSARFVFADTGWEAQETYDYLDMLRARLSITIDVVGTPGGMIEKIRHRAGFPTRMARWCTKELKVQWIRAYHDALMEHEGIDTISVLGIRAEESEDRAKMPVFGFDDLWGGYVWRPMIAADVTEVLAIHHHHGIPVNPLYLKGFSRVGCNPCIYATKEEIALTAEHFPQRIDQIRALEIECESARVTRNKETPDRYKFAEATFFQAKMADRYERVRQWVPAPAKGRPKGRLSRLQEAPPRRRSGAGDVARREGACLQAHAHRRHRVVVAHVAGRTSAQGDSGGARGRVLPVGYVRGAREGRCGVTPRTLDALRSAVARVLLARGESAEALVCSARYQRRAMQWIAGVDAVVCNTVVDWLAMGGQTRAEAIGTVWRRFVHELHAEHESAKRACASTRRPERKAAAAERLRRARAALAAAREAGE